ncbi:MAG: DUF411 domain-containing protein [Oceanospirillaceae bacterium]|nr:DUF411 domain-containing protein [Oceanospirillaceae bacterium]
MTKRPTLSKTIITALAILHFAPVTAQSIAATTTTDTVKLEQPASTSKKIHLNIHKDPNCGCCKAWVSQLPKTFSSSVHNTSNVSAIKDKVKVPNRLRSCHTAISDSGFFFEGHIPNQAIKSFLASPPKAALGLAVPGMPIGSPGMEVGNKTMRYPIYQVNKDGSHSIYAYATGSKVEN